MTLCDCGKPKGREAEACADCTFLDGTRGEGVVIAALREREFCTIYELEHETGRSRRSLLRTLASLIRGGRVRKRTHDAGETEPRMVSLYVLVDRRGVAA